MKSIPILVVLSLSVVAYNAQAHHVWIEQDGKQARLYFGEFNLNLREISPGLLDKLSAPTARLVTSKGAEALTLTKTAQAYVMTAHAAAGESIIAEEQNYPAYDKTVDGKTVRAIYRPAARYINDFRPQTPMLTLDVVPTGTPGELRVYFQGQSLAKAKVTVVAESGWTQQLSSDEQGMFKVALPWKSGYAVEVVHADATPGVHGADQYAVTTYVTTLSIRRNTGLAAPAAPAGATPSKEKD